METTARTLNARARDAHTKLKTATTNRPSEATAEANSRYLKPLPKRTGGRASTNRPQYDIQLKALSNDCFYSFEWQRDTLALTLDPDHAFFRELLGPLRTAENEQAQDFVKALELMLFAAARTEAAMKSTDAQVMEAFRVHWSTSLQTLLAG